MYVDIFYIYCFAIFINLCNVVQVDELMVCFPEYDHTQAESFIKSKDRSDAALRKKRTCTPSIRWIPRLDVDSAANQAMHTEAVLNHPAVLEAVSSARSAGRAEMAEAVSAVNQMTYLATKYVLVTL